MLKPFAGNGPLVCVNCGHHLGTHHRHDDAALSTSACALCTCPSFGRDEPKGLDPYSHVQPDLDFP